MADVEKRNTRKRKGLAIGGFGLAAAIGVGAFYFVTAPVGETKQSPTPTAPQAIPVQTAKVMSQDIPIVRSGLGVVAPLTKVDVKVRVDGTIENLMFTEGQDVKAGDVIAQIDPRPYEVAVDQAQATHNKDLAQLEAAKIDEARAQRLTKAGTGTTQASDTAAAQVAVLQATADGSKHALEKAKLDLSYATVKAPIGGRAGFTQIEKGAIVRGSDATGIVSITQMRPIAVNFTLTQDDLPDLVSGQSAAPLLVSVQSRDGSKHLANGKLSVIDSQVDSSTGMVKLKAIFPNDDMALWPGELISARIVLRTDANSTVVPSAALQNGQTGPYVWVVKPDKTVGLVAVKTGPVSGGFIMVQGLTVGDTIVTTGQSRLNDGTLISAGSADPQKVASSQQETIR